MSAERADLWAPGLSIHGHLPSGASLSSWASSPAVPLAVGGHPWGVLGPCPEMQPAEQRGAGLGPPLTHQDLDCPSPPGLPSLPQLPSEGLVGTVVFSLVLQR